MNWNDAEKACEILGDGWRLPTIEQLNILYQNKVAIGGFASDFYWSSTWSTTTTRGSRLSKMAVRDTSVRTSHSMFAPLGINDK
jgi:hypothetical protein